MIEALPNRTKEDLGIGEKFILTAKLIGVAVAQSTFYKAPRVFLAVSRGDVSKARQVEEETEKRIAKRISNILADHGMSEAALGVMDDASVRPS